MSYLIINNGQKNNYQLASVMFKFYLIFILRTIIPLFLHANTVMLCPNTKHQINLHKHFVLISIISIMIGVNMEYSQCFKKTKCEVIYLSTVSNFNLVCISHTKNSSVYHFGFFNNINIIDKCRAAEIRSEQQQISFIHFQLYLSIIYVTCFHVKDNELYLLFFFRLLFQEPLQFEGT